ncbi:SGNH/GDSL hydrolase family protein [Albibacterium sp.]|uniref:SGNH/GDSL hydrolase family protein n=1 Tax=Albibacterium sp. TaxID=2952885 RepID=UPI002C741AD4|nr:SGNH/GDSL hydrolase family protein [Albibacterium sp.]HUH20157.1 SGNH/GDSL hydrolase family protein [Albibacterium sp.]
MRTKFYFLIILCAVILTSATELQKPKRIIFFGDSITQAGVSPDGYITQLGNSLKMPDYELIGAGIGGNKVYDLYLRMEEDVLMKKPDVVVIYIGINDVWHRLQGTGTDYDKFIKFYQAIITKIENTGSKVILCTPTVIGEKKDGVNPMDENLDKFAGAIRELAEKNKLPLCDLRTLFVNYEKEHNTTDLEKGVLTSDGVHLNKLGNKLVADNLLPFLK